MTSSEPAHASMEDSVTRVLTLGYALGGLTFGALGTPALLRQWHDYHLLWDVCSILVVFVMPLVLLAMTRRAPIRIIRRTLLGTGIAAFALLATLVPAMHSPGTLREAPWFTLTAVIGVSAVCIAGRTLLSWISAVLVGVGIGVVRLLAGPPGLEAQATQDGLYPIVFGGVLVGMILLFRDLARRTDEATERARAEARESARRTAVREEDQWLRQFLHDEVLSVLVLAGRDDPALRESARQHARTALRTLQDSASPRAARQRRERGFAARDFAVLLQETVYEISPAVSFTSQVARSRAVPAEVRRALVTAVGEALRNSLRHAGGAEERAVQRTVDVRLRDERIDIRVLDDGVGFSMAGVGWDRMGVRESILGSIGRLPGGEARVVSSPGEGTRVEISWTRPGVS